MLAPQDLCDFTDIEVGHQVQPHQLALSCRCPSISRPSHRLWLQALLRRSLRLILRTSLSFLVCNIVWNARLRRRCRVGSGPQDGSHGLTVETCTGPALGLGWQGEEPLSVERGDVCGNQGSGFVVIAVVVATLWDEHREGLEASWELAQQKAYLSTAMERGSRLQTPRCAVCLQALTDFTRIRSPMPARDDPTCEAWCCV